MHPGYPGSTMILVGTVSSPKQTLKWLVVCNRLEFLSVKILVELLEAKYNRSSPLYPVGHGFVLQDIGSSRRTLLAFVPSTMWDNTASSP